VSEQVNFELAGMHHFTWIVRAFHDGKDRIGEALRNPEMASILGIDPELLGSLGAVPSPYLRYVFHPDRMIAQSQGRLPRSRQLMALQQEMLDDFRARTPGEIPASLTKRGARWYGDIVVPTLLMLAEKQSGELVLSVDNGKTLPWLPSEAIIEAPVPFVEGIPKEPRRAILPLDAAALVHRNCAYEILAVEAIVEKDRQKAVRALMENPLVGTFERARAVLDAMWSHVDGRSSVEPSHAPL
jgi:6-phospho-beta-glucosidase